MPDPIQDVLDQAKLPNEVKAQAWDAFTGAKTTVQLEPRLNKLTLPDEIKAKLWDLKADETKDWPTEGIAPTPMKQPPSAGSLVGTAAKTAAKDLTIAPFLAAGEAGKNAFQRERRAYELQQQGNYGQAMLERVRANPLVHMVVEPSIEMGKKALSEFGQGRYSEAAGHGAAALLGVPTLGLSLGPAMIGEQIGSGDPRQQAEAAGHIFAAVAGPKVLEAARVPKFVGKFVPSDEPGGLMVRAFRPQSSRLAAPDAMKSALADLKQVETNRGTPAIPKNSTMEPLDEWKAIFADIKTAKANNRAQLDQMRGPQKAIGAQVNTNSVADAMENSIDKHTLMQDPKALDRMRAKAKMYRGSHPVEVVDQLLQAVNAKLESYFAKFPQARAQARTDPATAGLVAEADALRDVFYKTLDAPGQGAAARELQQRFGALSELERAAQRRMIVDLRQSPDNLLGAATKVGQAIHLAKAGVKVFTSGDLTSAIPDIAAGVAGRKMAQYVREQQTPVALFRRALENQKDLPKPIQMPPRTLPMGQPQPINTIAVPPPAQPIAPGIAAQSPLPLGAKQPVGQLTVPPPTQTPPTQPPPAGPVAPSPAAAGAAPVAPAEAAPVAPQAEAPPAAPSGAPPDEWATLRATPERGKLAGYERDELQAIQEELEAIPFQKTEFVRAGREENYDPNLVNGKYRVVPGNAGAPVYNDILNAPDPLGKFYESGKGVGNPTRQKVINDIKLALKGGPITRIAGRAIMVARARIVGGYPPAGEGANVGGPLSKPMGPPAGWEPGRKWGQPVEPPPEE